MGSNERRKKLHSLVVPVVICAPCHNGVNFKTAGLVDWFVSLSASVFIG